MAFPHQLYKIVGWALNRDHGLTDKCCCHQLELFQEQERESWCALFLVKVEIKVD